MGPENISRGISLGRKQPGIGLVATPNCWRNQITAIPISQSRDFLIRIILYFTLYNQKCPIRTCFYRAMWFAICYPGRSAPDLLCIVQQQYYCTGNSLIEITGSRIYWFWEYINDIGRLRYLCSTSLLWWKMTHDGEIVWNVKLGSQGQARLV